MVHRKDISESYFLGSADGVWMKLNIRFRGDYSHDAAGRLPDGTALGSVAMTVYSSMTFALTLITGVDNAHRIGRSSRAIEDVYCHYNPL